MAKNNDVNGKKPFYKRVWFWVVVVVAIFVIGGMAGGV